jgi:hypothetical protein
MDRGVHRMKTGDGWYTYISQGCSWIKFNHKPDGETLNKLRRFANWDPLMKAWRAHLDRLEDLELIGDKAVTWESVGETPDDMFGNEDDGSGGNPWDHG